MSKWKTKVFLHEHRIDGKLDYFCSANCINRTQHSGGAYYVTLAEAEAAVDIANEACDEIIRRVEEMKP
jgi:hypothetical protein